MKVSFFLLSGLLLLNQLVFSQKDPLNAEIYTLKNGLTVMLTENHNTPDIFGLVAVKAGGKNDPKDATGMAHYLEHMLFKGTETMGTWDFASEKVHLDEINRLYDELGKTNEEEKRKEIQNKINEASVKAAKYAIPNEMDRMLTEIGGDNVNAFTTEDFTAYHNRFPSGKLEQWLQIYDHRFEKPVFRLFQSELETVYEEKNRGMDSPFEEVINTFNKNFWKNHPYGQQPIIGHTEHLKNPSLTKMYDYFNTYYVANNMVLVLSGDFKIEEAKLLIEKYFSDWRTGDVPNFPNYAEADFNGNEKVEIKATPIKSFFRAYRTPKNNHPDQIKIQIANYLLSNNEGSGMLDNLSNEGKLTYSGMIPFEYNDYGAAAFIVFPKIVGQSFEEAEALLDEQLNKLKKGDFDNQLFEGAKLSFVKDFQKQLEENESRALMLTNAFVSNTSWTDFLKKYERIEQLSKDDIVNAVNNYFGPNYLSIYSKMGSSKKEKLSKPAFEPVIPEDNKFSTFYQDWKQTKTEQSKGTFIDFKKDIERSQIGDLIELRKVTNPFNEIFSISLAWKKGNAHDIKLKYLPEYLNKLGTKDKSVNQFKKELFALGASLNFSSQDDKTILIVEGIEKNMNETLKLVGEFINNLKHDNKVIKILIDDKKSNDKFNKTDPGTMLQALNEYAVYGNESNFLKELSTKDLKKIKSSDFETLFNELKLYEFEVSYTGNTNLKQLGTLIQANLALTPSKKGEDEVYREMKTVSENEVLFLDNKNSVQTQFIFNIKSNPMKLDDLALQKAFNSYFGGDMSSLVFQEIREFRSLAYSTNALYLLAKKQGQNNWFQSYVGCQGDKTPEALEVMKSLFSDMPLKKEREEAIKSSLISGALKSKPSFRMLDFTVQTLIKMGYTKDPNIQLSSYYQDFTFEEMQKFYENQIKGKPYQLILVGNSKKFDSKILKKYGKVTTVKLKNITK